MSDFQPARVIEVEVGESLPDLPAIDAATGHRVEKALALVRLHTQPLGLVELTVGKDGIRAAELAQQIWTALGAEIVAHILPDEVGEVDALGVAGLQASSTPRCIRQHDKLLADAPFISVVVSTRDRAEVLSRCLRSLLALDYPHYEVLVIDNAPSSEATAQLMQREYAHLAHVRYFREERPGLSQARNRGVREARGEILAFTDDDVVVDQHWLSGLALGLLRAPRVGCVTGLVLPMELETQAQVWFEEFGGFGKGFQSRVYDLTDHRPKNILFPYAAGQFGSGNNMAFRAAAVRDIGGFDAALGAGSPTQGGEDLAAFVAVLEKGYVLVYEPGAIVHHEHRRDYAGLRKQVYDCGLGLTAFLTKCVVDNPWHLFPLAAKVPAGLLYALHGGSPKNRRKSTNYPSELTQIELRGMLRGPVAYLLARWKATRQKDGSAEVTFPRPNVGRNSSGARYRDRGGPHAPGQARIVGNAKERPRMNRIATTPEPTDGFRPVRILEVELSREIPPVTACDQGTAQCYGQASVLVRLHTRPLGLVSLRFGKEGLRSDEHAHEIWAAMRAEILEHLRQDGLPEVARLDAGGLPSAGTPSCVEERERLLADAPFVSVVVPTHDRPEHLQTCLTSLAALEYPRYEIIVVDNAPSTPAIAELARTMCASTPRARYVREERPGASWARNRGVLEARAEIIAFTDDDVVVDRYWLAELVTGFGRADNVGCVTGNVLPRELDCAAQAWFERRGGFGRGFVPHVFDKAETRTHHPLYPYCAWVFGSGNSMAFRTSVLRAIGGFDPALDPASPARGGEDLAAFFEVIVRGYRLIYEPAAIVRHLHRRSYDELRLQMYGWGVGFAAFLTRSLVTHLWLLPDFALKLPRVLALLLNKSVPHHRDQPQTVARLLPGGQSASLWYVEKSGYAHGVPAYLRARLRARRVTKHFGQLRVAHQGREAQA